MRLWRKTLIGILFIFSGCTYHGSLKNDFYKPDSSINVLPIKAYMVWDTKLDSVKYIAKNIYITHDAEISTSPGLKFAFISAMREVFEDIRLNSFIDNTAMKDFDVLLLPKFELRGAAVYIQIVAKDAKTDELIDKYEASGNIPHNIPTLATVLSVINVIPCALLCSPVIEPAINNIVGEQLQVDFESRITETLKFIVIDMKNDRNLKRKISK